MQTCTPEGAAAPAETDWDMEIDVVGLGSSPKTGILPLHIAAIAQLLLMGLFCSAFDTARE